MALSPSQVLDDASGTDVTFVLIRQDGQGTKRIDQSTTLASPAFLNVQHTTVGGKGATVDRHLVQMTRDVQTPSGPVTLISNFTLSVPRAVEVTNQMVYNQVSNLIDFLMSGGFTTLPATSNIDALLRGES